MGFACTVAPPGRRGKTASGAACGGPLRRDARLCDLAEAGEQTVKEPFPQPYLECIRRYNAGSHWHAHEVLEDLWRATGDPERRLFFQGVIQLAAAFVHAERGNMRGVRRLLAKAAAKLAAVPSPYLALDLTALLEGMAAADREAQAVAADPRRIFDWHCKPRLALLPVSCAPAEE
ncbi:MAG: DUF309 domain-containing protein [Spirochaetaceae bacterium]|nr:DUF309 domain-containing protein [Spirochaetaceae bacterium]